MTTTEPAINPHDLAALEFTPECEFEYESGRECFCAATHAVLMHRCIKRSDLDWWLMCHKHLESIIRYVEGKFAGADAVRCTNCRTVFGSIDQVITEWRHL